MRVRLNNSNALAIKFASAFAFVTMTLVVVLTMAGCGSKMPEKQRADGLSDLSIKTATSEHLFLVELALDERSQARGLMFRRSLAADRGMLFIYNEERQIGMWMKNTVLSLDMLFVKRDGTIATIFTRTEPFSERVLSSQQPVYGVLELIGGTVERLGIKRGDRVVHPLLAAQ